MPASVQADFPGTAAAYNSIGGNLAILILAALLAVYIVLGIPYESFIHPLTLLSTLPSAGVGALRALRLFHQDLDIIAVIGIIVLIGIVKKNGILTVDFALEAQRTANNLQTAIDAAQRYLDLANTHFRFGLAAYLDVYTAETSLLAQQQTFINLRVGQMTSNVQLVEALGGGWDTSRLASEKDVARKR